MSSFIEDHTTTTSILETADVIIEKVTVYHEQFDWKCKVCDKGDAASTPEKAAAQYATHVTEQHSAPRHEIRIKIDDPVKLVYFADEGTFNAFTNVGNDQRRSVQSSHEKKSLYCWAGAGWYTESYRERTPEETEECDGDDYGFGYITATTYAGKIYGELNELMEFSRTLPTTPGASDAK